MSVFKRTDINDVKVIIIGQDPYLKRGQATGVAFEVHDNQKIPPSLNIIYDEMVRGIYQDWTNVCGENKVPIRTKSLQHLCDQGVLLLNSALTVKPRQANTHQHIWRPFMTEVLKFIRDEIGGVFVPMGKVAQTLMDDGGIVPQMNFSSSIVGMSRIDVVHPAYDARNSSRPKFVGSDIFSNINKHLVFQGKKPIRWMKEVEEEKQVELQDKSGNVK